MPKSSNRTGYSNNRGSINKPFFIGDDFPDNPIDGHIFVDKTILHQFYYDKSSSLWIPFGGGVSFWTAGETLYRGENLYISQSNGKLYKAPTSSDMAIGFCYRDCSADDNCYFIRSGIAYVLPESGLSLSKGYVMTSSTSEAGRVQNASTVPSATQHFRETGHVLEDSSGNGVLTRGVVHHN